MRKDCHLTARKNRVLLTEPAYILKHSYVHANPSTHKCLQNAPTGRTKAANSHKQPIQMAYVC